MIACSAEKSVGPHWFNMKCVDIYVDNPPEGDWCCQHANDYVAKKEKARENQSSKMHRIVVILSTIIAVQLLGLV